jgi:hypothetical protein
MVPAMSKLSRFSVFALTGLGATLFTIGATSPARAVSIPISESNLFILDVSGSTNSVELWKNLKISVTSKLAQPFGNPLSNGKPLSKDLPLKYPVDISITSVSKNSQNSPVFSIVSKSDARQIWGTVEKVFPKSTDARLEKIASELFGDSGTWAGQAKIFTRSKIVIPSAAACNKSTLNSINKGSFLRNTDEQNKLVLSDAICGKIISIAKNLKQADDYFSKPVCDKRAICSDIAGAIYRSTNLAADLASQKRDTVNGKDVAPRLCIAIASDMLNESPGMSPTSKLNSKRIAMTATSLAKAKSAGIDAAKSVGISFPADVAVRAVMVGIGSGPNPIALDRNSYLLSYWEGFWTASGVKETNQAQSLNQACS